MLDTRAQLATHVSPRSDARQRLNAWSPEARWSAARTASKLAAAYDALFFAEDDEWSRARSAPGELPERPTAALRARKKPRSKAACAAELHRCAIARGDTTSRVFVGFSPTGEMLTDPVVLDGAEAQRGVTHCNRAAAVLACGHAVVGYSITGEMLTSKTGVPTAIVDKCGDRLCVDCAGQLARKRRAAVMERLYELQHRTRLVGPIQRRHVPADAPLSDEARALVREAERLRYAATLGDDADFDAVTALVDPPMFFPPSAGRLGRAQRRPYLAPFVDEKLVDVNGTVYSVAVSGGPRRRNRQSFRINPPLATPKDKNDEPMFNVDIYGSRFATFTQPVRKRERFADCLGRAQETVRKMTRSPVWKAHVDMSVIRYEWERSTAKKREQQAREHTRNGEHAKAAELRSRCNDGEWWHVHVHVLMWGSFFPQSPDLAVKLDRDPEDSLLMVWRRALVESGLYDGELYRHAHAGAAELPAAVRDVRAHAYGEKLRAEIRQCAHASNGRCWSRPLREKTDDGKPRVRIGGVHIKAPERRRGEKKLTPEESLAEVLKYATKPAALGELPHDLVVEVVEAIRNKRLVRCTGLLYGVYMFDGDEEEDPLEKTEGVDVENGEHVAYTPSGLRVGMTAVRWMDTDAARELRRSTLEAREAKIAEGPWPWPNTS